MKPVTLLLLFVSVFRGIHGCSWIAVDVVISLVRGSETDSQTTTIVDLRTPTPLTVPVTDIDILGCAADPTTAVQTQFAIVGGSTYYAAELGTFLYSSATAITVAWTFPGLIMTNLIPGELIIMVRMHIKRGFPNADNSLGLLLYYPIQFPHLIILRIALSKRRNITVVFLLLRMHSLWNQLPL
jgi:hypothetical protein